MGTKPSSYKLELGMGVNSWNPEQCDLEELRDWFNLSAYR